MKNHNKLFIKILGYFGCGVALGLSAAAQSQSTTAPASTAAPSATGADVGVKPQHMSVQERNAMFVQISKQDFPVILQSFIDAGQVEHDPGKQDMLWRILAGAMRERTPLPEFFAQLKLFIENNANSRLEREQVISALALAATKESTDLLIHEATTLTDKELKDVAIGGIAKLGDSPDEKLTPALEKVWGESHDPQLLANVAMSLASIGKADDVQMLLNAAFGPQDKDNRRGAAFGALDEISSPHAVPPLAALFNQSGPGTLQFQVMGDILVTIGDATATQALLTRLQTADDDDATQIKTWVQDAQTPAMRQGFAAALDSKVPFRSEAVRQAIQAGVATYQQGRAQMMINRGTPPPGPAQGQ